MSFVCALHRNIFGIVNIGSVVVLYITNEYVFIIRIGCSNDTRWVYTTERMEKVKQCFTVDDRAGLWLCNSKFCIPYN